MLDIPGQASIRNLKLCRYGLLFCIGVVFGSIVMFYKSLDLTSSSIPNSQFMWSQREQSYVPLLSHRSVYSSSVQYILIVTYMRSGSSFTADILQHHPEAFYVFEPLYSLHKNKAVNFLNGTKKNLTQLQDLAAEGLRQFETWYKCDLYNVDYYTLKTVFMSMSIHTSEFYKCIGKAKLRASMLKCLPTLIKHCKESKVRIIKTIRMNMNKATYLLKKYNNFKIIHLLRDPRGILNSRMLTEPKHYTKHILRPHSKGLCSEMEYDVNVTNRIKKTLPNRVTQLQYEDLAERPYSTTAKLYHFLGTVPSLEIYGYVYCITSMGGVHEKNYDIRRSDSRTTSQKWKLKLTFSEIKLIDSQCAREYKSIGYLPVLSMNYLKNNNTTRIKLN